MSVKRPAASKLELLRGRPVLVAGLGSIGRRHVRNLQALGVTDFVFYRTRQGTLADDELSAHPTFTDLDEALARKPALAIVANPTASHLSVAQSAAEAGCHLLIEKPLSHSRAGVDELAAVIARQSLTTLIGCQFRFHPLLAELRRGLAAGRLGRVIGARAEWGEYLPDWHPWEDHRRSYSARSDLGGGVVLTLIHPLDYMYWLFGPVDRVHAETRAIPSLETAAGEDWAEITLRFSSGVVAAVHLDYWQKPAVHTLEVTGEAGSVRWDYHGGTLTWRQASGETTESLPEGFERNTMFVDEMRHFLECAAEGRPTDIPLADGIAVLDVALGAKQSAETGEHVALTS